MSDKPYSAGTVFAIEGLFGVGKSTLAENLQKSSTDIMCIPEQFNSNFLQLFYNDPKKYGFAFQWGMLNMRLFQKKAAAFYKTQTPPKLVLWDRSVVGDYVFAMANRLTGSINEEEFEVYESEFQGSWPYLIAQAETLKDIDCFLYLYEHPSVVKHRVENVRRRESEKNIPYSYYNVIDLVHFNLLMNIVRTSSKNVVFFAPDQFGDGTMNYSTFYQRLYQERLNMHQYKANITFDLYTIKPTLTNEEARQLGEEIIATKFTAKIDLPDDGHVYLQMPSMEEPSPFEVDVEEMLPYPDWFRALVVYYLSRSWSTGKTMHVHVIMQPPKIEQPSTEQVENYIRTCNKYRNSTCDFCDLDKDVTYGMYHQDYYCDVMKICRDCIPKRMILPK